MSERPQALVTGASGGLGSALVKLLADRGAFLAITSRSEKALNELISQMPQKENVHAITADLSQPGGAARLAQEAAAALGHIDVLVNNAGMNWDGVSWKMSEEQWDRVLEVNLKGYFNFTRQVAPLLKEQKYGRIINVTSINGLRGKFGQTNYSASKAGIIGFTKALAKELGAFGVTVNAVAPGLIETAMLKESEARDKIIDMAMAESALKQVGQPEDLAYLVSFLASDRAKHITGEIIKVDGGQYI